MATNTAAPNNKSSSNNNNNNNNNNNSSSRKNNSMKLIKTNNYHLAEAAEQFDQPNSEDEADEREYQEYKRARKLKKQQKKDRKEEKARVKLEKKVMKRTLKEKGEEAQEKKVKSRGGSGRRQSQGDIPYEKRSRMATLFFRRKPNSKAKVASPVAVAVVRLGQVSRLMKESEESDLTLDGGPSNDQGIYRTEQRSALDQQQRRQQQQQQQQQHYQGEDENTQIDQATLISSSLHASSSPSISSLTGSDVAEISKPHHQGERGEEEEEEEEEGGIGGIGEEERAATHSKTNFGTTSSYWCRVWSKFKRSPKTLPRSITFHDEFVFLYGFNGVDYTFDVIDTAGQDEYRGHWNDRFLRASDRFICEYVTIIVAANKSDLDEERELAPEIGKEFAQLSNAFYIEIR
ncbi:hypothetical protein BGZ80_002635 [Entomortierella chlamydospora]|uniref:Uncharacterized protein n=1 Tax=Entomortierella chlamydospora TaxID=101097 RepID=A0A9P6SX68_9FUNG|nr:hypothetical protein BGZ80_002635 [Entomortierella chlamydospora]